MTSENKKIIIFIYASLWCFLLSNWRNVINKDWWASSLVRGFWMNWIIEWIIVRNSCFWCCSTLECFMLSVNELLKANCDDTQWFYPGWIWFSVLVPFKSVALISQSLSCFVLVPHVVCHLREHPDESLDIFSIWTLGLLIRVKTMGSWQNCCDSPS